MPSAGRLQPLGFGYAAFEEPWDWQAGWFMVEGGSRRPTKLPHAVAWLLGEACSAARDAEIVSKLVDDPRQSGSTAFQVELPAQDIERSGWVMSLPRSSLLIPRPRCHEAVAALKPGQAELRLPFRHVELIDAPPGIELRSNPARLVRTGTALEAATVRFRGWESRYDAVSIDRKLSRLHLNEGPGRALDPEEYPACVPPGHSPLFNIYTTFESAEVIRVDGWQDLVRQGCEARHLSWVEHCRRRLPRTLRILRTGGALRLSGYGDSITSLGGRHRDQVRFPNGPDRDHIGYFEQYGADWREVQRQNAASTEDCVHHHQLGWNWYLKNSIEQRWPVAVEYLNWGLPGTTTGFDEGSVDGVLMPNGSNEGRLELLLRDKPDLVTVAFGTNDVGMGVDTRANIVAIVKAIHASGAEAIVVGPCPPNPGWGSRDPMLWLQTYDDVIAAAREADVAFVPTLEIFGEGREGAIGLSQRSYSAASMGNHPGPRELAAVGKLLSAIIP